MIWLANLLDRFLNWLVPMDFDYLLDDDFADTFPDVGDAEGSPDPAAPDGDGTPASATVPVGFTDDEIIASIRSYLSKFGR